VDRKNEIIRGVVLAQEGPFKSEGRGEFNEAALREIATLTNASPNGLKSRLAHPTLSSDGVGKFLGRMRDARIVTLGNRESNGEAKLDSVLAVRADMHLDPSAHKMPGRGDAAEWLMTLAESDPDAISTSLVFRVKKEYRLDKEGKRAKDDKGEDLPPLWFPTRLHASDVVDTGDAVDGMLSIDGMPDGIVRQAYALASEQFDGVPAEIAAERLHGWVDAFLAEFYQIEAKGIDPKTIRTIIRNRGRYTTPR
jgi:hypothetical protein